MAANRPYLIDDPSPDELKAEVVDVSSPPLVSFCIPTYNDEDVLGRCLQSIRNQTYPNVEIVIVDGHSNDDTVTIANEYTENIHFDDGKLGSARQTAFEHADGELIGLFDADIILPHDEWLSGAVRRFNYSEHVSTVWIRNVPLPDAGSSSKLYLEHCNLIVEDRIENGRGYFGGGNSLFRRDSLEAIGGIDPDLHWGEDFDWARELEAEGFQVVYYRDQVYHATALSWRGFVSKQFTGAETFAAGGFGLMGLSIAEVLYEQYVIGFKGMVSGLWRLKWWWILFPLYIALKTAAYGYTFVASRL